MNNITMTATTCRGCGASVAAPVSAPRPDSCPACPTVREGDLVRLAATREGGAVRRCHIVPHHGQYNVAQHTYGAVSLLLLLHPEPSVDLIKAVQWHDVGERWLGDMPAPAKWENPALGEVYEAAEEEILDRLGLMPDLTEEDRRWLKAVDTLELWLWCREEEALGNERVIPMRRACEKVTEERDLGGSLPRPVSQLYGMLRGRRHARLSDFFEEVLTYGLGEAET